MKLNNTRSKMNTTTTLLLITISCFLAAVSSSACPGDYNYLDAVELNCTTIEGYLSVCSSVLLIVR